MSKSGEEACFLRMNVYETERGAIMRRLHRKGLFLVILTFLLPALIPAARAEEEVKEDRPTANVSVDVLSQYIWRGYALSKDSAVIQPSVTVSYKGFP